MEVTKEVIEENLKRIEEGKPLTMPLVILNGELKKEYFRRNKTPEEIAKQKEYYQRPEVKAKQKEYHQRPEVKAKQKEYRQRLEVKAKQKEYYQRPEVKAKQKEYYQKNRDKILAKLKKRREVSSHSSTH